MQITVEARCTKVSPQGHELAERILATVMNWKLEHPDVEARFTVERDHVIDGHVPNWHRARKV